MCPLNDNCSCHEDDRPRRIQLSRRKGWRLPEGAVKVDRSTPWGNPFTAAGAIEHEFAADETQGRKVAVEFHRTWLLGMDPAENDVYHTGKRQYDRRWVREHLHELAGHDLACWCGPEDTCHADLLLKLAATVRAGALNA